MAQEEKLEILRGVGNRESILTNPWFILTSASVVFILTLILIMVQHLRLERERQIKRLQFDRECLRCRLTPEEKKILINIVRKSRVESANLIFLHGDLFEEGVTEVLEENFAASKSIEERKKINLLVDSIKSKIGFKKDGGAFGVGSVRRSELSSRGIPLGKKVMIGPVNGNLSSRIGAVITENNEREFVLRPEMPLAVGAGEIWSVHYEFGPARWEFNAAVITCGKEGLALNHCDGIKYVNRRRFLRVCVERDAFVASFPMVRGESYDGSMIPDFIKAKVNELSGPGLRIDSELKVLAGDRVIVVFELEPGRYFEDIGVVRWCKDRLEGNSMGVELIGLSDSGVDELVRVTNSEAVNRRMEEISKEHQSEMIEETVHG
jgi:hypothetical protein